MLTSFLVANAISLPITGWLTDLLGRKRLFIAGHGGVHAHLGRGGGGAQPGLHRDRAVPAGAGRRAAGAALAGDDDRDVPGPQRGMAMAIWGIGIMFAPIIGPTLGGWITDNWSWRWVFYINVPVGAAAVGDGWLFLPDSTTERPAVRRVDVPGLVLLVVGRQRAAVRPRPRASARTGSPRRSSCGSPWWPAVALVALVVRELRTEEPVVDLRVLRHPTFAIATAAMFVISIAFYGIMVLSPLFTQILMGYTAMLAGMVLAPGGVSTLVTMPIAGVLMNRMDPRWMIVTGCALNAYAMYLMATLTLRGELLADHAAALHPGPRHRLHLRAAVDGGPHRRARCASWATPPGSSTSSAPSGAASASPPWPRMLERGSQAHQARLAAHVSLYDPDVWDRYQTLVGARSRRAAPTPVTAEQQAWAHLTRMVQREALLAVVHRQLLAARVDLRGRHPVRAVPRPPPPRRSSARRDVDGAGDR